MSKTTITNWDLNICSVKHPHFMPEPYGFNINIMDFSDPRTKVKDIAAVKTNVRPLTLESKGNGNISI